jgi:predicted DNA-binding protein
MTDGTQLNTDLRVRVSEETRRRIEALALERSEPGDQVSVSALVREAISEYLDDGQPDK